MERLEHVREELKKATEMLGAELRREHCPSTHPVAQDC